MKTSTNTDPGKMGGHKPINEMLDLISVKLYVKIVGSTAQNSAQIFVLKQLSYHWIKKTCWDTLTGKIAKLFSSLRLPLTLAQTSLIEVQKHSSILKLSVTVSHDILTLRSRFFQLDSGSLTAFLVDVFRQKEGDVKPRSSWNRFAPSCGSL